VRFPLACHGFILSDRVTGILLRGVQEDADAQIHGDEKAAALLSTPINNNGHLIERKSLEFYQY
jgi:hypothetical protein